MERMKKVKLEREILKKNDVLRTDVERAWIERARYFWRSIENLGAEIAATLVGLEAVQIQELIDSRNGEILDGYISNAINQMRR